MLTSSSEHYLHSEVNAVDDLEFVKQRRIQEVLSAAFPHPQAYSCSVLAYVRSHGQMIIEVVEMAADAYRPIYLDLETVWYFEGPFRWQGIDFRIASSEECHALLNTGWIAIPDHRDEFGSSGLAVNTTTSRGSRSPRTKPTIAL
jgi:hypothetical protein